MTTFERILVANNGMAATKFLISMHSHFQETKEARSIQFYGMVSPEDLQTEASYVSQLDYIVLVPSGPSAENYGNVDLIVRTAKEHACDAVWPGWGHASENFLLAQKLEAAGIVWIGPSWQSMRQLGDKVESLLQAQRCGVPCVPWSGDSAACAQECGIYSESEAVDICDRIGYPVMLKASNGGGGRGIRRVVTKSACALAFRQVRLEVPEGLIFAMKCLDDCRHVEVQIVGDGRGRCMSLATRDCSIQRRHQKLIEEGPAPFIASSVLAEMERAAERLCASVCYGNAGTVEFLFHSSGFFFLEVNCRLQVEHPVTELLWGINLPAIQVAIAAQKESLDEILGGLKKFQRHVIGCRIVAEDPLNNWLPSSGEIVQIKPSSLPTNTRSFQYFSVGGGIHQFSDSQFGHVFCAANTRSEAVSNLSDLLKNLSILGAVANNVSFMGSVVLADESFRTKGPPATNWLDTLPPTQVENGSSAWLSLLAVSAHLAMLAYRSAEAERLRWVRRGHRAPHVPASYTETLVCSSGAHVGVCAVRTAPNRLHISLSSSPTSVSLEWTAAGKHAVLGLGPAGLLASVVAVTGSKLKAQVGQGAPWHLFEVLEDRSRVSAPMNGRLVRWLVEEESLVTQGSPLCEIEAMKMVSVLHAKLDGTIGFNVREGVSFIEGDWLASILSADNTDEPRAASPMKPVVSSSEATLSSFEQMKHKLDGFEQIDTVDSALLNRTEIDSLLAQFLCDEQLCKKWITDDFTVIAAASDFELTTVWRHRLSLQLRMETVAELIGEEDGSFRAQLDPQLHAFLIDQPSSHATEAGTSEQSIAESANTFYIHDLPAMLAAAVELVSCQPLSSGTAVGMMAWLATMNTPECPQGREVVFIGNDITYQAGSFALEEDQVYLDASALARARGIPRVFIACNSGARLGLCESIMRLFRVQWKCPSNPALGAEYLYLNEADYEHNKSRVIASPSQHPTEGRIWIVSDVLGGSGVENLMGSGAIAGESSRCYDEIFTLTYVTGRTVGIGAYIARLCQRVIQKESAPILLTGFQALNKLIGAQVYHSNAEIGGPEVMFRNGVSHLTVKTDKEGIEKIIEWLAFIPAKKGAKFHPIITDSPERLLGQQEQWEALFDRNSFVEVQSGWAKSVIVGRARLGGIPIGVIVVQTRQTQFFQPADPADPHSQSVARAQAGQVWYPDSAYKTAQAIQDFNKEELPLIILANWRGFSGGQRDMFNEILKFGSYIVDALRVYQRPVFVYLPPKAELRGGAWVVIDARINPEQIEMYADPTARGGVLEPAGTVEIKFRDKALLALMVRSDPVVTEKHRLNARFEKLKPTLTQIACKFADMHDTPNRMLHIGAIQGIVPWENSRAFFCKRLSERLSHA